MLITASRRLRNSGVKSPFDRGGVLALATLPAKADGGLGLIGGAQRWRS